MNMPEPQGTLAPAQYEIMQIVWDHGKNGATVAKIWQTIRQSREVTRTTVLNQVDRLEKRGWLCRRQEQGGYRYTATVGREQAEGQLARQFVDEFFDGSASHLVMSLLGSRSLKANELERLRELLDEAAAGRKSKGPRP